ncbi:MAG: PQQ-dependent sugar dehydrogenase [Spirochaetia bacterium]
MSTLSKQSDEVEVEMGKLRNRGGNKLALVMLVGVAVLVSGCVGPESVAASEGVAVDRVESEQATFRVVQVASGLARPWGMAFLPDGRLLVTERVGGLLIVEEDGSKREVSGLPPIAVAGQGGLLDVILDPEYESSRVVYLSYVYRDGSSMGTAVARATLSGTQLEDVETIFEMSPGGSTTRHFGSRFAFLPDGTLLFTIGDRGERSRAQDLGDHAGKTIRINTDGSVPSDNPFVDDPDDPDARAEVYTYGNRNAQGMTVHPQTEVVWQHEHGPKGGDEINIVQAGANYGWPLVSYGDEYSGGSIGVGTTMEGVEDPLIHWTPSIAPSGMDFYEGSRFPEWQGDLFVGALAGRHLRRVEVSGERVVGQERLLDGVLGRIRDVETGPDGFLYLITDANNGGLFRLEPVE